jgi:predicted component of type VI protein secretion system
MSFLKNFRTQSKKSDYKSEILENLCDLLNTKRGFGSYPRDLGLDSYVYLGSHKKIVLQIIEDIKACFEKYEKRIHEIEVIQKPNDNCLYLTFSIKCKIDKIPHSFHLSFHHKNNFFSLEA